MESEPTTLKQAIISHNQNESQEKVGDEFLALHDAEHVCLLLISVLHEVVRAEELLDAMFRAFRVRIRHEA